MIDITDLGEYSCIASNEHGVDKTCARLITGGYQFFDSYEILFFNLVGTIRVIYVNT